MTISEFQRIIEDIFDFQDTMAREVMVHIHRTLACPSSMSVAEIARQALAADVRFVPIYDQRLDNLAGFLDVEETLTAPSLTLPDLLHEPVFFPDTKRIPDLYMDMSTAGHRVVFLSNEYGRISGIITPAEIVAEIIGRRPGSREAGVRDIVRQNEGEYLLPGLTDTQDFRNETGIALPEGPYDTVGGFLLTWFGRIPEVGEALTARGATFEILDRDEVHIKRPRVRPSPDHRRSAD